MNLTLAILITQMLLAFAIIQQSLEHLLAQRNEQILFIPRLFLGILLMLSFYPKWACLALAINSLLILNRFQGPYNGGSDRIGLLTLFCLTLANFMPYLKWQEYIFGYLAMQVILSYFISGWVKIVNEEWRNGMALKDVFLFSAYPASEALRKLTGWPRLLLLMSWVVMLFELLFPLAMLNKTALIVALAIAAIFHLANAFLFGLNRFFWFWIAAYPSILWLQQRIS